MDPVDDAPDRFEQERRLDNLLEQIVIRLRNKYGKGDDCPQIFPAIVRTIIWNIAEEATPKIDSRKNKVVSAEILEKRQASVIFVYEIDGPIRGAIGRDKEVLRKYLLSEMLKRLVDVICAKAWSDYHVEQAQLRAKE